MRSTVRSTVGGDLRGKAVNPHYARTTCCDRGNGRPSGCPRVFLQQTPRDELGTSRTSSPCDVLNKYASGPSPCGCPVARPSPRSRYGVSCIMRVKRRGRAKPIDCDRWKSLRTRGQDRGNIRVFDGKRRDIDGRRRRALGAGVHDACLENDDTELGNVHLWDVFPTQLEG
jgi:hypothetical protein